MKVSLIVAVGPKGEIGQEGRLPWPDLRDDMRWFVEKTRRRPVIMGRKSWDSLPTKPLLGRYNLILTRDVEAGLERVRQLDRGMRHLVDVVSSPEDAIVLASAWVEQTRPADPPSDYEDEILVLGGGEVYRDFMYMADRVYMTRVEPVGRKGFPEADRFFYCSLLASEWDREHVRSCETTDGYRLSFSIYTREVRGGQHCR